MDKRHSGMVELETKPDFEKAMERIYAWYENEIIVRPPIRFSSHNEQNEQKVQDKKKHKSLEDRWLDSEYQVERYLETIRGKKF